MTLTLTVSDEVRALASGFPHVAVEAHDLVSGPCAPRHACRVPVC